MAKRPNDSKLPKAKKIVSQAEIDANRKALHEIEKEVSSDDYAIYQEKMHQRDMPIPIGSGPSKCPYGLKCVRLHDNRCTHYHSPYEIDYVLTMKIHTLVKTRDNLKRVNDELQYDFDQLHRHVIYLEDLIDQLEGRKGRELATDPKEKS